METKTILFATNPARRLDQFIAQQTLGISRSYAKYLIKEGDIRINGKLSKPSDSLTAGDRVDINLPSQGEIAVDRATHSINIIYEDDDVIVVDKPAGLTCHPALGHPYPTLTDILLAHFPPLANVGDEKRPGLVHRLDKDTSGLLVIAKTGLAFSNLVGQFHSRTVFKLYLALIRGYLRPEHGFIQAPIARGNTNRQRMVIAATGRDATTEYKVAGYASGYTLLQVRPLTGRTHQIRVHLKAVGYPVVGDTTYGGRSLLVPRQFLHAHRIGFKLPSGGDYVEFTSPLPPDLGEALAKLGLSTNECRLARRTDEPGN